jgi:hypothetical protein
VVRGGEIGFAAAGLRHLLHEVDQAVVAGQHEGVYDDALLLTTVDFFERAADDQRVEAEGRVSILFGSRYPQIETMTQRF